jgi:hypothetical protein
MSKRSAAHEWLKWTSLTLPRWFKFFLPQSPRQYKFEFLIFIIIKTTRCLLKIYQILPNSWRVPLFLRSTAQPINQLQWHRLFWLKFSRRGTWWIFLAIRQGKQQKFRKFSMKFVSFTTWKQLLFFIKIFRENTQWKCLLNIKLNFWWLNYSKFYM